MHQKLILSVFQGTNDLVVPMDGSMSAAGGWGGAPKIQDIMNYWADINECSKSES